MESGQKWIIVGVIGVLLFCLIIGVGCVVIGGISFLTIRSSVEQPVPPFEDPPFPFSTQIVPHDSFEATPVVPQDSDDPQDTPFPSQDTPKPADEGALNTLRILDEVVVPVNDPRDLALRLEGKENIPETVPAPEQPFEVGSEKTFWVSNVETNANFQVTATLEYSNEHLNFWIENGVRFDERDLRALADTFSSSIYPTNRAFFGSEWSPGIDNDPRLYVLFARGLGNNIAGYFSSADSVHPEAHRYSNAHEMFLMNADVMDLGDPYIYSTMAHEFQHMIHWYLDRNEESWMNEGFAVLSEFLNGYDIGGFDYLYVREPDMQLTYWPSPPNSTPHYGASFLFLAYFLDRFGDEATQALVADPENGMDSIDNVLEGLGEVDPSTGQPVRGEDVFADWVLASFLNDERVGDGRYAYQRYTAAPSPDVTEEIRRCTSDWQERTVHQFGVDYIQIGCSGDYTLQFQGSTEVGVLPVDANSGEFAFWSNKGDESDMTLTQTFDFSQVSGPITLEYSTWYDLEEDYDYLYLVASEDGESWQILETPSGRSRDLDPSGNAFGWGYNGTTSGWIEESVDISQFAGKEVQLRFEYVTDAAVNGEGLLLDDVRIPAIDYSTDFESDDGGWEADGFARIQNRLPQIFRVSLIEGGREVSVQTVVLDANQQASIPLSLGESQDAVLVVSGVTRFTTQEAAYRFRFDE